MRKPPDYFMQQVRKKRWQWYAVPPARKAMILDALLKKQDNVCVLCRERIEDPAMANIDHLRPLGRGGDNAHSNLAATHIACNNAKGVMTFEEWRARILS